MNKQQDSESLSERRSFLGNAGILTLSATTVALMSGTRFAQAETTDSLAQDIIILNSAIAAEHEAVAAYQLGAESGLLSKPVLAVAVQFQGHHKEHIDALTSTVKSLGGEAVDAKDAYSFPVEKLKAEADVLGFAAELERGAVSAYVGAIPAFDNSDLAKAAASILADEAMHWAILRQALGQDPVPGAFFS